jgi:enoyl-[acyl-carrier protein] reductase III
MQTPTDLTPGTIDCQGRLPPLALFGLQLFNAGEYFEAHEALETAWRDETGPVRELYRGILQVGVAYYHLLNGNYTGAVKMLERCKQWLEPFPDDCRGIELARFREDFLRVERELLRLGPERLALFDRGLLKKIHYRQLAETEHLTGESMTDVPFLNKIALVTGSGRGIGRAIALRLAQQGADVAVNYVRNQAPAEETVAQIQALGRRAFALRANVGKTEDIDKLFDVVQEQFGGLDIFISNAASGFNRPALEQKVSGWDFTLNVNARALLFAAQRAAPLMAARGGGAIVSISSPGGQRVMPDYVAVGASKAALEALTRYLAVELAGMNIAVNAVSPGLVETDALQFFSSLKDGQVIPRAVANTPAGRLATPEDVAGVVAFLCSPAAAMIRGQVIVVDGGYTLTVPM